MQKRTDTRNRTSVSLLAQAACIALAWAGEMAALAAEPPARIVNRALAVGGGKEVDAAVKVVAVDSRPVVDQRSGIEVAPGEHIVEVMCTARVFVGMGTVDFPSKSALTVNLESGHVYRLDAKVTVQGDCTPILD